MIFVGAPTGRLKGKTLVLLVRVPGQRWYHAWCDGPKSHYDERGGCVHIDELLERTKPAKRHLIKVQPFGNRERAA